MKLIHLVATLALLLLGLSGCVGTFGEARPAVLAAPSSTPDPEKIKRCDRIDNLQLVFGGTTLVLGAAAGGAGFTAWKVKSDGAKDALIIGAGIASLLAVGTGYIWDSKQKQWVREGCASISSSDPPVTPPPAPPVPPSP